MIDSPKYTREHLFNSQQFAYHPGFGDAIISLTPASASSLSSGESQQHDKDHVL